MKRIKHILMAAMVLVMVVMFANANIPPAPAELNNDTGDYWVNYTWSEDTDHPENNNVTDSFNVSMNYAWHNGTATFLDADVGPGGWANITVWAYNATGNGNMSAGSRSDSVQALAMVDPTDDNPCTIMHPDSETRRKWIESYNAAPKVNISGGVMAPPEYSVLDRLDYNATERDQDLCGNCWVWAATGCMEVAHDAEKDVFDRLSIQYLNSLYYDGTGDGYACEGGNLDMFVDFYSVNTTFAIPWNNTNASWQDGGDGTSTTVPADSISTTPHYTITHIEETTIPTQEVGDATAIENIKSVLASDNAIWFAFYLPTGSDWDVFMDFWNNGTEADLWSPDYSCGHTWIDGEGGGHAVLCVGYNATAPEPYWIMLNSWGTANGNRTNGLFRMNMDINYDCWHVDEGNWYSLYWQMLDMDFAVPTPTNLQNTTGNYWVNYIWTAGTGIVTDGYNVSMNGTWHNRTETFLNSRVGAGNWSNITVWAWNATGNGNMSADNISDNVQAPSAAAGLTCDCDICVNTSGWWSDGGVFNANATTPIQAAVDAANQGETIHVAAGSYDENVDIGTSHLTLVGEGADEVTVTAASASDPVFYVAADYVNISGFDVTGATSDAGIYLDERQHCNISDNNALGNYCGIHLYNSSNNTLTSNDASNNDDCGIKLSAGMMGMGGVGNTTSKNFGRGSLVSSNDTSDKGHGIVRDVGAEMAEDMGNNMLVNNIASDNGGNGICLCESSNNTLTGNTANSNDKRGIHLYHSSNNTLANNTANSNENRGIWLTDSCNNNTLTGNTANLNDHCGIQLKYSSSNNMLVNNIASSNNYDGIRLAESSNDNTLTSNTASSNDDCGIRLCGSSNNTLASNNASDNEVGIELEDSSNNTLTSNNASDNDDCGIYLYRYFGGPSEMHSGSYAWYSHDDYGNQDTTLNRTFDLTGVTRANLTFWHWYYTESRYDGGRVEVNNGSGWTPITPEGGYPDDIWILGNCYAGQSNGWVQATFNLTEYAGQSINLSFRYAGDHSINHIGWYIDDISISEISFFDDVESGVDGWTASSAQGSTWSRYAVENRGNLLTGNTASDNSNWDIYIDDSPSSTFTDNTLNGTTVSFTYGGDVSLKGVSSPAADPSGRHSIGKFISATDQSAGAWLYLNFSYSDSDLDDLVEASLTVWKHNGTAWVKDGWDDGRYLDTTGDVVGANITSFSVFAPMGVPPLHQINVTPTAKTLGLSESQDFIARGYAQDGAEISGYFAFEWAINDVYIGSLTRVNDTVTNFTAEHVGITYITARNGSSTSNEVQVTVDAAEPTNATVTNGTATATSGDVNVTCNLGEGVNGWINITAIGNATNSPDVNSSKPRFGLGDSDKGVSGVTVDVSEDILAAMKNGSTIRIEICCNDTTLTALGIDASTLAIWKYNSTEEKWVKQPSTRSGTCAYVDVDHLGTYGLFGSKATGSSTGGGGSGSRGTYPPGWLGTPTPTVTATKAPAASANATATDAPPGERVTPVATKTKPAVAKATTPAAEGTTAGDSPGLAAVFVIAGILAVAYAMMRRRE